MLPADTPFADPAAASRTLAETLERQLACEILRGERAAGSRLPSVRALAASFEVTVPTIQRVIAGLEAHGLVRARHGSGVEVRDPVRAGGLSVMPLWFEAYADDPVRAAAVLADFLELRRVFAVHLASTHRLALVGAAPRLVARVAELHASTSLAQTVAADLGFSRALLEAAGNVAAIRLFHTIEELVAQVPFVAEALYGDRGAHLALMQELATRIATVPDAAALATALAARMSAYDAGVVERFASLVAARPATRP